MQLEILGIGDAFTSLHYNTSFLSRSSKKLLIDAPPGIFRLLRERSIDRDELDGVIITHVHGDHVAGLETLLLYNRYFRNQKTPVYTSRGVFQELSSLFFPSFSNSFSQDLTSIIPTDFDFYVDWVELDETKRTVIDEELSIEIRHNWHPATTLGLKLFTRGGTIGISGDNCFRPNLLRALKESGKLDESQFEKLAGNWLWDCDLIYHEVAQGPDNSPHTLEKDLLQLPTEIHHKLRLIHLADDFSSDLLPTAVEGERVTTEPRIQVHVPSK